MTVTLKRKSRICVSMVTSTNLDPAEGAVRHFRHFSYVSTEMGVKGNIFFFRVGNTYGDF